MPDGQMEAIAELLHELAAELAATAPDDERVAAGLAPMHLPVWDG